MNGKILLAFTAKTLIYQRFKRVCEQCDTNINKKILVVGIYREKRQKKFLAKK